MLPKFGLQTSLLLLISASMNCTP